MSDATEMACYSALYTVDKRCHATVEEVMRDQGLDRRHAHLALETLFFRGLVDRSGSGVYLFRGATV